MLYFVTSNPHKFAEVKAMLPYIEQLDIDLPEIQDIDPHKVIRHKLEEALKHAQGSFVVEDTSLSLDCLNGLPGTFIKWFLVTIGNKGLLELVEKYRNNKATAKTLVGYATSAEDIHFFEGDLRGTLRHSDVTSKHGWDSIFEPEGSSKTFSEMSAEEKNAISMRRIAFEKLQSFIAIQKTTF